MSHDDQAPAEIVFVAPGGATQSVQSPVAQVRLRAAGWRPRTELEALAARQDPTARAHLARAAAYQQRRDAEQAEREARFGVSAPVADSTRRIVPAPGDDNHAAAAADEDDARPPRGRKST
ncbi:hypothetical protein [Streptomyces corynorhini]|uniref:Uncharacterized protein n=1 Tax=Streptomyces corynorhini TaxID=2282652 RepID=A0A370BDS8_9ACTN|nr:hypothetical protein [Streptomyces corynorhini]RDG37963.1 hypothetical protein DVH02_11610 [Streptomyces corynorhini]